MNYASKNRTLIYAVKTKILLFTRMISICSQHWDRFFNNFTGNSNNHAKSFVGLLKPEKVISSF